MPELIAYVMLQNQSGGKQLTNYVILIQSPIANYERLIQIIETLCHPPMVDFSFHAIRCSP